MKHLIKLLAICFLIFWSMPLVLANNEYLNGPLYDDTGILVVTAKEKPDEPDLKSEMKPFENIVDWTRKSQRQNYQSIFKERGYTFYEYQIRYINKESKVIDNPYHQREYVLTIKKGNDVAGYIWAIEEMDLPNVTYNPNPPGFWLLQGPRLICSKNFKFEIIEETATDRRIKLSSFKNFIVKGLMPDEEKEKYRNAVKMRLPHKYRYTQSLLKILKYADQHFQDIKELFILNPELFQQPIIFLALSEETINKYRNVQKMIREEIRYGGEPEKNEEWDDWQKMWKVVLEEWPSMRKIE